MKGLNTCTDPPSFAGTFETRAGGGLDLLTGVLTPAYLGQQRLWFGKTYTNSHTGQDRKRSILPNGSDFYFRNCTSEPICRNWLWEALDVGRSTLSGQSHDTPVNATMIGQIAMWLEIAAVTISQ